MQPASRRYPRLFSPIRLGPLVLENRVVFAAHLTNFAEGGLPSAKHASYYAARAEGGVGLVITEEHSTHPSDWPYEKMIHGFLDGVVERYRMVTDAVHRHGTPIFAQINHNGAQSSGMYTRRPVWAPSPVADPLFREVPRAVDDEEIGEIIAGYGLVARRCREGGFDGIELQCSHSSIVRQFLSPRTNLRLDRYGGGIEQRARFLLETVEAVRRAIGPDLALGVRLCGDELVEGGTTIEDAIATARLVEAQGCADYLNTSIGVATETLFMIEASMHVPPGYASFVPSALRAAVELPVVGVGRYKDPGQAERALKEGHCDLVGIVRGQIADPDFARKARSGRSHDIRLCLSCNQECVGRMGLNRTLGCIENPSVGKEGEARPAVAKGRRDGGVVVVGAGPGGLQAAMAAARRGLSVTVYERDEEPGGQVRLAARVPNRAELGDLVRNQLAECRALGVEIVCGIEVAEEDVLERAPSAVVVATGARPSRPAWADESSRVGVADVTEVLRGSVTVSGRVLVVDEIGFHQATSVAEWLADGGCSVEIVTPAMVVGQGLGITLDLEHFLMRAQAKSIVLTVDRVVMGLDDGAVRLLHHPTGREERREVDLVVTAVPPLPEDSLYRSLVAAPQVVPLHRVGDCLAPRRAHAAVIEGERVGALV